MKLDLGCGTRKKADHIGVDRIGFEGVDVVLDVGQDRWPWNDGEVDEIHSSHMLEHLKPLERVHFANEVGRVLKKGGKATIIVPHWSCSRAYGDMTHEWPPVAEAWLPHLNAEWRKVNAPHEQFYTCDLDHTFSYAPGPSLHGRNAEYVQFALMHYKEAAMDLMLTLIKSR